MQTLALKGMRDDSCSLLFLILCHVCDYVLLIATT